MKMTLREIIKDAEDRKVAIGHFNVSDIVAFKAIARAARDVEVPVIIGVSEGEREFVGVRQIVALVKSFREEYDHPIFLNADHTRSLEGIKEAVEAGFDAVIFDGADLPLEENIRKTKEVVRYVRGVSASRGTEVLVEGELGYIGKSSELLEKAPEGAAIRDEDLTTPESAKRFVVETGVDLFAPAVGNIHGIFKNAPNPRLNLGRIKEIRRAIGVPLVLHGGSGISDEDFANAIKAGISVIHINTEIRVAWREGLGSSLRDNPDEVAPYKLLRPSEEAIYRVVARRLKLFSELL